MNVQVLIENTTACSGLQSEHGLSLYIETESHKLLFDAGETNAFLENAQILGVDLSAVDTAILSHGHYDHGGGMRAFLSYNKTAPLYLSRYAFSPCYHGQDRYIGIDPALADSKRLIYTEDELQIDHGLTLFSCNKKERSHPIDSSGLTVLANGTYENDLFLHEQYLLIEENGKRVLVSGCSHKGILNIISWFQPDIFIGGFHFMNLDPNTSDAQILQDAAMELLSYPTIYYTGHCTGCAQYDYLKEIMADRLHVISTGMSIHL